MKNTKYYTDEELDNVKKLELKILQTVDECCHQLDVSYFVVGGTALGAVRHGGFIPWDDDIDIGMTRDNYNRFIIEAPRYLEKKNLFLQDFSTEKKCPYAWAKVRLNGTSFVEYCHRNLNIHQGIYIDIFPFDEVPLDIERQKEQYSVVQHLLREYAYHQTPDITEQPISVRLAFKYFTRRIIYYLHQFKSIDTLNDKLKNNMTKYNGCGSGRYTCLLYPKFIEAYMTSDMILNPQKIKFENLEVLAPNEIEKYLTLFFGDYMKLPPENARIGHRPYKIKI